MTDKPWPQEWCDKLYPYQLELLAAMKQPTFIPVDHPDRRMGKFHANVGYIKFCLKQNLKLLIGTSRQKEMIEMLREHFPAALFVIMDDGVEIKIKDKKELEI